MPPMGTFHPPQKGKNRGVKGWLEGREWLFFRIILTYLQEKQYINKIIREEIHNQKAFSKIQKRHIF